jgi:hypothetical protein
VCLLTICSIAQEEPKAKDKKKDERMLSPREGSEISGPMNVQHKVHVNKDFQWSGNDMFDLSEKLGEGCVRAAAAAALLKLILHSQRSRRRVQSCTERHQRGDRNQGDH